MWINMIFFTYETTDMSAAAISFVWELLTSFLNMDNINQS
jgi:hypothetical protein